MRDQVIIFVPWEQQQQGDDINSSNGNGGRSGVGGGSGNCSDDIMQTIYSLVEALVIHLNSIYHSNNLIIGEVPSIIPQTALALGDDNFDESSGLYQDRQQASRDEYKTDTTSTKKNLFKKQKEKTKQHQRQEQQQQEQNKNVPTTPTAKAPPFELVVIEALLGHVCSHESNKASHLIQTAQDILSGITYTDNSSNKKKDAFFEMQRKLGELLPLKNKVDELEAKCSEVASAIADVLKHDEDMAAMRLSEIAALRDLDDNLFEDGDPYNLHVEVELLFEDYLLQMDEVLHSLRRIQSSITNTEEVVEIELDLLRNRIMRYEMLLELTGLVVGIAAAVTGAFGMNLVNHFEDHPRMFYEVLLGLLVFMGATAYAVLRKLSMDSIL